MSTPKKQIDSIDATPSKRIYRSIIADYDLLTAVSELVDNAIDGWESVSSGPDLKILIDIDLDQQKVTVEDNAGGIEQGELKKLVSPGESSIKGNEEVIGIFGVGSKRAAIALAQMVRLTTRYHKNTTFRIEYDDEWLKSPIWSLPYYSVENIRPSSTRIELSNLRFCISENDILSLREHLSETYACFFENRVSIILNDNLITATFFDNWAYPPDFEPKEFSKNLSPLKNKNIINFQLTSGLINEKGTPTDYGVYFYCNKRLICKALKSPEVGFISGLAGVPHLSFSLSRTIVKLRGPSDCMPWTSNKSAINYNHFVFQAIKSDIIQAVKTFNKISKRLKPNFEEQIRPYKEGAINSQRLQKDEQIKPNRLPEIPKFQKDFKAITHDVNKELALKKPWTRGLYEGVIAEKIISNIKTLEQKNRISLIILDSTLEIAFKDYLAYEIKKPLGDDRLIELFRNRKTVHDEVSRFILPRNDIWTRIGYFYQSRCDLIHRKANSGISDEMINSFRRDVKRLLQEMHTIQFPD